MMSITAQSERVRENAILLRISIYNAFRSFNRVATLYNILYIYVDVVFSFLLAWIGAFQNERKNICAQEKLVAFLLQFVM